jgi:undecaprenyl pyrophosphate phosphatase UppP
MDFSVINEFLLAIFLGLTQGVTEFLPISSTAHVRIVSALTTNGRDIGLAATNLLQFGTVLAIINYFWRDLKVYFERFKEVILNPKEAKIFLDNFGFWWNYPSVEDLTIDKRFDEKIKQIETEPKQILF